MWLKIDSQKNIEYEIKKKEKQKRKQRKEHVILPDNRSGRNFRFAPHCGIEARNKFAKLKIPFR